MLKTAAFFEERRQRAAGKSLQALLLRRGGEAPREGDELPPGYVALGEPAEPVRKAKAAVAPRRTAKKKA